MTNHTFGRGPGFNQCWRQCLLRGGSGSEGCRCGLGKSCQIRYTATACCKHQSNQQKAIQGEKNALFYHRSSINMLWAAGAKLIIHSTKLKKGHGSCRVLLLVCEDYYSAPISTRIASSSCWKVLNGWAPESVLVLVAPLAVYVIRKPGVPVMPAAEPSAKSCWTWSSNSPLL